MIVARAVTGFGGLRLIRYEKDGKLKGMVEEYVVERGPNAGEKGWHIWLFGRMGIKDLSPQKFRSQEVAAEYVMKYLKNS